jgi:hypothetical protein
MQKEIKIRVTDTMFSDLTVGKIYTAVLKNGLFITNDWETGRYDLYSEIGQELIEYEIME